MTAGTNNFLRNEDCAHSTHYISVITMMIMITIIIIIT
jgi:hypothetical protein